VKACDRKSYEDGLGAESLSKKFFVRRLRKQPLY